MRVSRRHGVGSVCACSLLAALGASGCEFATGDITMSRYVAPLGLMLATAWVVTLFVLASGATS